MRAAFTFPFDHYDANQFVRRDPNASFNNEENIRPRRPKFLSFAGRVGGQRSHGITATQEGLELEPQWVAIKCNGIICVPKLMHV